MGSSNLSQANDEIDAAPSFISHMQTKVQAMRVKNSQSAAGVLLHNRAELVHVYDRKGYTSIWSEQDGWNNSALRMMDYLSELPRHGLDPDNYHYAALTQLLNQVTLAHRIHADLLLSDAFISLATDLSQGATSRYADSAKARRLLLRLRPSADPSHEFDALLPSSSDYWALTAALKQRLNNPEDFSVSQLPGNTLLKPGLRSADVTALRDRLVHSGDLSIDAETAEAIDPTLFSQDLSAALGRFQQRHGLDSDGMLGPVTRAALNRDNFEAIEMISLNLERWRQLKPQYADSHVRVNIAAQELAYIHQGRKELSMKVIAGRTSRPTPTTSSAIREIVFNPYWNVPTRIATVDKLPQIRQNPHYLTERGFSVRASWEMGAEELDPNSIDWNQVTRRNFSYFLRQDPGPQNALGQVKFLFPNDYSVYLHDTPGKNLFDRGQRLFSSGCIRLDQPMALAEALLRNHTDEQPASPVHAQSYANNQSIRLLEPVSVHLEYWTAWVDDQGQLQLRNDVYQRDQQVLTALRETGAFRTATRLAALSQQADVQLAILQAQ